MNAFIEMRNRYFDNARNESFAEYYLSHRCYVSEADDIARNELRNKIASIRLLYESSSVAEADLLRLLAELGDNLYLDRYAVDLIIQQTDQLSSRNIQDAMVAMLSEERISPQRMVHLLDICIECSLALFSNDRLYAALMHYRNDLGVFSVLLEYVLHFSITSFFELLYGYLGEHLPQNIKMQIIDILIACDPDGFGLRQSILQKLRADRQLNLYAEYLNFHHEDIMVDTCGIVVLQPMFYGDPEDSGKGKSGGLATLLRTLGNQLSKQQQISQVITLTVNQEWNEQKPFLRQYAQGHWLVRLPLYWSADDPHAFVRRELSIKRAVARFLSRQRIEPDLFHVRYLDNASLAMAMLCKQMHAKLVFTLTPDPHRNMVDADGDILCFHVEDTLEKLNKVTIGDALLTMTDGVVGIGGDTVKQELELYFPQLHQANDPSRFRMIGEGIDTDIAAQNFDVWQFLENHALGYRIRKEDQNKPVILNVGRLSWQKGQHHILKAWGESKLWQDFNLVIIGGSQESRDADEQALQAFFEHFMAANPNLIGRFAHIEALPNEDIRRIERKIMTESTPGPFPNIYVCSSIKEEFGISILEAMSEGFLAFVPVNGGAKTYITHGVNGFLLDTANESTMRKGMEQVLYHTQLQHSDYIKIQHAGQRTVLDQFSIQEIAKRFLELYLGISDSSELLCVANESEF